MPVRCDHHQARPTARGSAAGTKELKLRGAAWAGDYEVRAVDVSIDFGASWQRANLSPPKNRYDWRRWTATAEAAERRLLRGVGAAPPTRAATCSRTSPATGTRKATAPIRCTASPSWSGSDGRHDGWITGTRPGMATMRRQSPSPGSEEKYFLNFSFSSRKSSASAGASFFAVMFGQVSEYWRLSSSHLLEPRLGVGLDGVHRAFRLADAAVDALVGMDDEHVLAFVEAVDGTDFHAVRELALDAVLVDDIGHALRSCLPPVIRPRGAERFLDR